MKNKREPKQRKKPTSAVSSICEAIKSGPSTQRSARKPAAHSRSFAPRNLTLYENALRAAGITPESYINRISFFDGIDTRDTSSRPDAPRSEYFNIERDHTPTEAATYQSLESSSGQGRHTRPTSAYPKNKSRIAPQRQIETRAAAPSRPRNDKRSQSGFHVRRKPRDAGQPRSGDGSHRHDEEVDMPDWIENAYDNSDRHALGLNLLVKMFGAGKTKVTTNRNHRPYFTYWITVIQIVIYIVAMATYGVAPIGLSYDEVTSEVIMTNLALEPVSYRERANMFIGPRQDDLIHMGAKYSPCMRKDVNIEKALAHDKYVERETACCVYSDGSGCVQSNAEFCNDTSLMTWFNWTETNMGYQNRLSGSVCGQDPKYCETPSSTLPFIWSDDISLWPICTKSANATTYSPNYMHMTCEVVGRPCCVGIQGECIMATREYCDFRRGYFHPEAALCSQVSCMEEVCGMMPFLDPQKPDHFYRLFTSLFLHSGLLAIAITVIFQFVIMRDMEKLIGWWRMTLLYLGSGVAGSLASSIFIPYYVEAGPSGSLFGVLALLFLEVIRWNTDEVGENPTLALIKLFVIIIVLFLFGLVLPQVDNWAHLFGFVFGMFLVMGLHPFDFCCGKACGKATKVVTMVTCLVMAAAVFAVLVVLFYVLPVYDCAACVYFNCIPFTGQYCEGMDVKITRETATM